MVRSARDTHPVVCGTDFSPQAAAAADVAAGFARTMKRPLVLAHVVPAAGGSSAPPTAVRSSLRREAIRLRTRGVAVTPEIRKGHPDEALAELARTTGAELLVVSALGARLPTRRFLGSVAERLAEAAPVPTLVVRQATAFDPWLAGTRPLRVFLGYDFTVTADAAVAWIRDCAALGPCVVTAGYVTRSPEDERRLGLAERFASGTPAPRVLGLVERQLADRLGGSLGTDVRCRVEAGRGRVDLQLVGMAIEARADLVVVGTHQRRGLARWWAGSVSRGVLAEAPASVLVLPVPAVPARLAPLPTFVRALVAVDLGADSARAVAYGCALVEPGGTLRIVHVVHPRAVAGGRFERQPGRSAAHARHLGALGRRLEALRPPAARQRGVETEAALVEADEPHEGLCAEAERFDADAVVVATKGAGLAGILVGSVAQQLLARIRRPVLVVPPQRE